MMRSRVPRVQADVLAHQLLTGLTSSYLEISIRSHVWLQTHQLHGAFQRILRNGIKPPTWKLMLHGPPRCRRCCRRLISDNSFILNRTENVFQKSSHSKKKKKTNSNIK